MFQLLTITSNIPDSAFIRSSLFFYALCIAVYHFEVTAYVGLFEAACAWGAPRVTICVVCFLFIHCCSQCFLKQYLMGKGERWTLLCRVVTVHCSRHVYMYNKNSFEQFIGNNTTTIKLITLLCSSESAIQRSYNDHIKHINHTIHRSNNDNIDHIMLQYVSC